jgi:hypothetical protein
MKLIFIFVLYFNLDDDPTTETILGTKIDPKGLGTPPVPYDIAPDTSSKNFD